MYTKEEIIGMRIAVGGYEYNIVPPVKGEGCDRADYSLMFNGNHPYTSNVYTIEYFNSQVNNGVWIILLTSTKDNYEII